MTKGNQSRSPTPGPGHALKPSRARFAAFAAAVSIMLAVVVAIGWGIDMPALRSLWPGAVEMKANTALGLVLTGTALWLTAMRPADSSARRVVQATSVVVVLLGAATAWEYISGQGLGIDELLVRETGAAYNQARGRMSPYSALSFVALGIALLARTGSRAQRLQRVASGLVLAIGVVSVVGHLWNAAEIVTDRIAPPVAINTACAFVLLGLALLLLGPTGPLPRAAKDRVEALVLRGVVPVALLLVVGGGITYESAASFSDAAERVSHTQAVRAQLAGLYGAIASADVARRNSLLVSDAGFEREFDQRVAEVRQHVAELARLIQDNPPQLQLHGRLAAALERHIRALEAVALAFREGGRDAARAALAAAHARGGAAQEIAEINRAMDESEVRLLADRLSRLQEQRSTASLGMLGTLAISGLLFALLFRAIRREMSARLAAEEGLRNLNARLEQRVSDRTEELAFQRAFLRRVVDANPNFIFARDREGRFVTANRAFAESMNLTVDEVVGRREQDLVADDAKPDARMHADLQVIDNGEELLFDEAITTYAGEPRWLTTAKRPLLSPDGSETLALTVSVDMTSRKQAEDEVRQLALDLERRVEARTLDLHESNLKLQQARLDSEAANRAKSAFLANMSHEIRTPMNAVIGLTHLMMREMSDPVQRGRLNKVSDAAHHLLQLINDILDVSKIEAGKLALNEAEFSLETLLASAAEMVSVRARDKGLELILDSDSVPSRLIGDSVRLSQILINLLSNAVKFTDSGWVKLRCAIEEDRGSQLLLRFEVQDTGPGIAVEQQALLFKPFERADTGMSRRHEGTGLGLSLSRQLALAMGGDAGLVSEPGVGSTFWVTAALGRGSESPTPAVHKAVEGLRALVVDDLPEALAVIGERLTSLGLHVDTVDSGSAALQRIEAQMAAARPYDLLVIDWRMEPIDGIETMTRVRALLGEGTPPSILATAFDDPVLAEQARAVRYDAVLLKPITSSTLQDTLARVLRVSAAPDEPPRPVEPTDGERLLRQRHSGKLVLLAEDNAVNREVAQALLTAVGLVVETAEDGAQAVRLASSGRYDLVLMDVHMPVLDGLEATRAIRRHAGAQPPVIAMTANAFNEDRQACLEAGMNDHISKPVDPQRMYATLLRWLTTEHAATDATHKRPAPAIPDDDALRRRLAALDGFDLPQALRNVAGHFPALARALRQFVATYAGGLAELLPAGEPAPELVSGTWPALCHSMRGALATVGATGLLQQVQALETALQDGAPTADAAALARRLHQDLVAFVSRLRAALDG